VAAGLAVGGGAVRWRGHRLSHRRWVGMEGRRWTLMEVEEDVSTMEPMEVGRRAVRMTNTDAREEEGEAYRGVTHSPYHTTGHAIG
jgi:hypothetical protein